MRKWIHIPDFFVWFEQRTSLLYIFIMISFRTLTMIFFTFLHMKMYEQKLSLISIMCYLDICYYNFFLQIFSLSRHTQRIFWAEWFFTSCTSAFLFFYCNIMIHQIIIMYYLHQYLLLHKCQNKNIT